MASNRTIIHALDCYVVAVIGNSLVSFGLFHLGLLNAVESIFIGIVVGMLMGLTLAAMFWGKL